MNKTPKGLKSYTENALELRVLALEQNGIPGVRDFFATSALSILSRESTFKLTPSEIAFKVYAIADAMMKERERK